MFKTMKTFTFVALAVIAGLRGFVESRKPTPLYQRDFDKGTLIIGTGSYILMEDISFCPRPTKSSVTVETFMPTFPSKIYDMNAFAMGFFAAILVKGNNVNINLNGKTLQQCDEHALVQRFFTLISLSSAPFTTGEGPHEFVGTSKFVAASNVNITGPGTLGQSSHHGIHGNENKNIRISNVNFEKFEVAAIHLNNVDGLTIEDNRIRGNRQNVPVLGTFNAALAIRPYMKRLKNSGYWMTLRGKHTTAVEVYNALSAAISNVYNDVMKDGRINKSTHPMEFALFDNPFRVPEGSCYGILVYGHGPATNGFALEVDEAATDDSSSNIIIQRNTIRDIKCFTKEVPATVMNSTVVVDARGAVLQMFDALTNTALVKSDGTYGGNILSDAQIMVASAIHAGTLNRSKNNPQLLINKNTIHPNIVRWANGTPINGKIPKYEPKYRCLSDALHHVTKGMVGIRLEETIGFEINGNTIDSLQNLTPKQYSPKYGCHDIHAEVDAENGAIAQDANIRGISISAARAFSSKRKSKVSNNYLRNFFSSNAVSIVGIAVQGDAKGFDVDGNVINLNRNSKSVVYTSVFIGPNADDKGKGKSITMGTNQLSHNFVAMNKPEKPHSIRHRSLQAGNRIQGACPYVTI